MNLILTYTYDKAHLDACDDAAFHRFALARLRKRFKSDASDTTACTNTFVEIPALAEHRSTRREFNPRPIVSYYIEKADRSITRPQIEARAPLRSILIHSTPHISNLKNIVRYLLTISITES